MTPFEPVRVIAESPLRQFLIPAPGGRLQVSGLAYDPAKGDWFDVFGNEDRGPDEWGFWANRGMNWNSMCVSSFRVCGMKMCQDISIWCELLTIPPILVEFCDANEHVLLILDSIRTDQTMKVAILIVVLDTVLIEHVLYLFLLCAVTK